MGAISKDVAALNAQFVALQAQLAELGQLGNIRALNDVRGVGGKSGMRQLLNDTGAFRVESVKAISQTEAFTNALRKQDVTLGKLRKSGALMNEVYREQYRLSKMSAMGWSMDARGRITADMIIPKNVPERLTSLRKSFADVSHGAASWGQVIEEQRIRLGTYAQALRGAGLNLVNLGKNMQWAGRQMMVGMTLPFAALGAVSAKAFNDVDQNLTKIVRVYDFTDKEMATSATKAAATARLRADSLKVAREAAELYAASINDTLDVEGQLAASGQQGHELMQNTLTIQQASLLGQMDYNKTVETAIALNTVFGHSAQDVAKDFDYMNAMENATVLTMQDFTEALPRVAGLLQPLGGSLQDIGLMLTAMKAASIPATQGANALKSALGSMLLPTARAQEMLGKFNINIQSIVDSNQGNLLPSLKDLAGSMNNVNMTAEDQVKIMYALFGKQQAGRLNTIVNQLRKVNDETTQMGRAARIGSEEYSWAIIRAGELAAEQESASFKFRKALQVMRVELAAAGEPFLKFGTMVLGVIAKIFKAFNGMGGFQKKFLLIAVGAAAILGPLVMLTGIMFNFAGTIIKTWGGILQLASGFKILSANEKLSALVAKQRTSMFATEAQQADRLALALEGVNQKMATEIELRAQANMLARGVAPAPGSGAMMGPAMPAANTQVVSRTNVATRQTRHYEQNTDTGKMRRISASEANARSAQMAAEANMASALASQKIADDTAKTSKNWTGISQKAMTMGFAASMVGTMATDANSLAGKLSQGLMIATMIGMALGPEKIGKFFGSIGTGAGKAGTAIVNKIGGPTGKVGGAITKLGKGVAGLAPMAGPFGIALAVAAGSALILWKHMKKVEEQIRNVNNAGNTMTEVLGGTVKGSGKYIDETGKEMTAVNTLVDQFKEKNKDAYGELQRLGKKGDEETLKKRVIQIGTEVMTNTNDPEKAKQAVQVALAAAGNPTMYIDMKFSDPNWVAEQSKRVQQDIVNMAKNNDTGEKHGFWDLHVPDFGMDNEVKGKIKAQAEELGKAYDDAQTGALSPKAAQEKFKAMADVWIDSGESEVAKVRNKFNDEDFNIMKKFGVDPSNDRDIAYAMMTNKKFADAMALNYGGALSGNKALNSLTDGYRLLGKETAKTTNTQNVTGHNMENVNSVAGVLFGTMEDGQTATQNLGKSLLGTASDAGELADAIEHASGNIAEWAPQALKDSWGSIMDYAKDQYTDAHEQAVEATQKKNEEAMAALDAEGKLRDKAFDKRGDAIDTDFDRKMAAHDKRWKLRMKNEEDAYDLRIQKIDDSIQAEQDAESIRQKIFEAEKSRMQRLAEMANTGIDINMALNSGNMDEAAKLINNARSTQAQWAIDDASATQGDSSEARIKKLEDSKKPIEEERTRRMEYLNWLETAETNVLERDKKRREDALAHEKEMYQQSLEARKKAEEEKQKAAEKTAQKSYEADQRALDQELAALRAYIPKNKAEQEKQVAQLEAIYQKHHVYLNTKSAEWGTMVTKAMDSASKAAQAAVANDAMWKNLAENAAKDITGAFGMTPDEFMAWVTTGKMPAQASKKQGHIEHRGNDDFWIPAGGGKPMIMHTGGYVAPGTAGGRNGYSNMNSRMPSEVDTRLKVGEYVVKKGAVNKYGTGIMDAINEGNLPIGGGSGMGPAGFVAAAMAGVMKSMIRAKFMNAGVQQAQIDAMAQGFDLPGAAAGQYGQAKLDSSQMQNAATIFGVGKSMGASDRDVVIALMTALQESGLKNINYGDRDSVGLFQQRTSQGWGTVEQIMDPKYASRKFFEGLLAIDGRDNMALTAAAQAVQRSAFPNAYAKWEDEARAILAATQNGGGTANWAAGPGTGLAMPVRGTVTSHFGMRTNPVTGKYVLHNGADIAAPVGTPIHAAASGTVLRAGPASGYGNWTVLGHPGGLETGYAHQSNFAVKPGQQVSKGQVIGYVGMTGNTTGPHLHFQTGMNGNWSNPNQFIPGLKVGGNIMSEGIARLHEKETVLTAPLSENLKNGIRNLDQGAGTTYNVTMDLRGAYIKEDVDIESALDKALAKKEGRLGRKRKIT